MSRINHPRGQLLEKEPAGEDRMATEHSEESKPGFTDDNAAMQSLAPVDGRGGMADRLTLLAEAGGVLGTSLDLAASTAGIAGLLVPAVADFCFIDLIEDDRVRRVEVAHVNPAKQQLIQTLLGYYSVEEGDSRGSCITHVLRESELVLMAELSHEALGSLACAAGHSQPLEALAPTSALVVPLVVRGFTLGAITVAMSESGRRYCEDDSGLLMELALRAAMAIDNALRFASAHREIEERMRVDTDRTELLEREKSARSSAESAEERFRFIAEASAILVATLEFETTLASLARLLVPRMADWCAVDMCADDGSIRRLAVAHLDPAKVEWAHELQTKFPPNPHAPTGVPNVLRTGRTEYYPEITDEMLVASAQSEEELQIGRQIGFSSVIVVPLVARGRTLGAITLVHAESGRRYSESDVRLAEELAGRAAIAVDNAILYGQAEQARVEAESANRAKDQFLAVLSHELRTPLNPILISVQSLESDTSVPAHIRPLMEIVRRNIELEARLIDDLLDLTRITRGKLKLNYERVDIHAVVGLVLGLAAGAIETKNLVVKCELAAADSTITGDSARMQQVIWNLLQNAVKFTPAGGLIRINTSNDSRGHLRIDIIDSGIGMEPDVLQRIFDAFEQGETTPLRKFGGLGLGLTISKALIEMHDGTLSASSAGVNRGATFTIGLNTQITEGMNQTTNKTVDGTGTDRAGGAIRILLVDDHEDTNMVLKLLLQRKGYQVFTAHDVRSALEVAAANEFDVLVSDIGLPDGSGLELMRALLERYAIKGIALSGFGMEDDIRRSREAGFSEHLVKPVNPQRLQEVIQQVSA